MLTALVALIFALISLIPVVLVIWLLSYAASTATVAVNQCRKCGYDLRGLSRGHVRTCPECGHPFEIDGHGDAISPWRVRPAGPARG